MCNEEEKTHLHIAAVFFERGERHTKRETGRRGSNKDVQGASAAGVKLTGNHQHEGKDDFLCLP